MPILVRNVRLGLDEPESRLVAAAAKRLKVPPSAIRAYAPVRRSLDARNNSDVHFVYHVEVALHESEERERSRVKHLRSPMVAVLDRRPAADPKPGTLTLERQPIIVGFGPAGMFAALRLVEFGFAPIVLERGADVRERHRDVLQTFYRDRVFNPESNLLFGEGGAGTYSDGKLYTRLNDPLVSTVLESFFRFGAPPETLTDARPHVGSDRLPTICRHMRQHIERAGGEVRFGARVDDIETHDGRVRRLRVNDEWCDVGPLILAIGHSARDTVRMLRARGVAMTARPFQVGVRIEHPQSLVDRWQYGPAAGHDKLPPAEYHVVAKNAAGSRGDCYSFCMCPGGIILPTNESESLVATNGASRSARGGPFANSGLVMTINPPDSTDPLAGMECQRHWEANAFAAAGGDYSVPCQRAIDFLDHRTSDGAVTTSYPLGGAWTDVGSVVPPNVAGAIGRALRILDKKMPGFAGADALVTGPETRASSTVRFTRNSVERCAEGIENLYPAGEGAGYAGGIVSSAIDGIKTADAIIRKYAPIH